MSTSRHESIAYQVYLLGRAIGPAHATMTEAYRLLGQFSPNQAEVRTIHTQARH